MIVGHEAISEGDILVHDSNATKLPPLECGPSMIIQSNARLPYLALLDNVAPAWRRTALKRSQRELGIGFIHVSNSQDEAMALTDIAPVFIGGRNILRAARTRRRPLPPERDGRRPACVAAVDDQGSQVRIAVSLGEGVDPSVLLRNETLSDEPGAVAIPRH